MGRLVRLGALSIAALLAACSDSNPAAGTLAPVPGSALQGAATTTASDPLVLDLRGKDLIDLPADLSGLQQARVLRIACNERMVALPASLADLANLEELDADNGNGCQMSLKLAAPLPLPAGLRILNLSGALDDSTALPVAGLQALERLDLSRLHRQRIPVELLALRKLKVLRLEYSNLRDLSGDWRGLAQLEELHLCCNYIDASTFPDLSESRHFRLVQLGNNKLSQEDQRLIRSRLPASAKADFEDFWDGDENED